MEERERLEARRCGISVSRGEEEEEEEVALAEGSLGPGGGEGGWREEVEEAMVGKTRLAAANASRGISRQWWYLYGYTCSCVDGE